MTNFVPRRAQVASLKRAFTGKKFVHWISAEAKCSRIFLSGRTMLPSRRSSTTQCSARSACRREILMRRV